MSWPRRKILTRKREGSVASGGVGSVNVGSSRFTLAASYSASTVGRSSIIARRKCSTSIDSEDQTRGWPSNACTTSSASASGGTRASRYSAASVARHSRRMGTRRCSRKDRTYWAVCSIALPPDERTSPVVGTCNTQPLSLGEPSEAPGPAPWPRPPVRAAWPRTARTARPMLCSCVNVCRREAPSGSSTRHKNVGGSGSPLLATSAASAPPIVLEWRSLR